MKFKTLCLIIGVLSYSHTFAQETTTPSSDFVQLISATQEHKSLYSKAAKLIQQQSTRQEGDRLGNIAVFLSQFLPLKDNWQQQLAAQLELAPEQLAQVKTLQDLAPFEDAIIAAVELRELKDLASYWDNAALERALKALGSKYPDYPTTAKLKELEELKSSYQDIPAFIQKATLKDSKELKKLISWRQQALIDLNPEAKDKHFFSTRRFATNGTRSSRDTDRPANWQGISSMPHTGALYSSEIVQMDQQGSKLLQHDRWLGHVDLDFSGQKLMFTTNGFGKPGGRPWDIFEFDPKTKATKNLSAHMPADTDSSDSCYLPDGRIHFLNTSGFQGVPCVTGTDFVGNIHLLDPKTNSTRRLTLDQDNNWFPTLLSNGRVMFLRWEYTESAHYFSRILMHMNPDGTDQKEYYGSNSYWPNSLFNAKDIPGKPGMFIGIVSGHHGVKRLGELILFDVNRGRTETEGAVQKLPGFGKPVENVTKDELVNNIKTPFFAEPYPLSPNYFYVAFSPSHNSPYTNIALVDTYDNIVPLTASQFFIYAEPIVSDPRPVPPIIPDRVNLEKKVATAYIADVYHGRGMQGVPRGQAKSIRVFMSEYSPRLTGGHYAMGMESNWDLKVLYGTTPVLEDGSAMFEVPANQPVTLQILDAEGKALTLMRSWFTAMPGETLSCIGCHENQNEAPPAKRTLASRTKPAQITPFLGDIRSYSFLNEIQPILDGNCIGCHDGSTPELPNFADTQRVKADDNAPGSTSYWALHPFVRRNGPEGDYRSLRPTEFAADTSELVQLLLKNHHGVQLQPNEWKSLFTWIDMNVPYLGEWEGTQNKEFLTRRYDLHNQLTTITKDYSIMDDSKYKRTRPFVAPKAEPLMPKIMPHLSQQPAPIDPASLPRQELNLGDGVKMPLVKIPAGEFIMGSNKETPVEAPARLAKTSCFWMGANEVTLAQYRQFDQNYKNGVYDMHYKDQVRPGYDMDVNLQFPVIRVSYEKALLFCDWLSKKTGKKVSLPTEEQWEYAAKAGSNSDFFFGDVGTDFAPYANLADTTIKELAVKGIDPQPIKNPSKWMDFVPRDPQWNDKVLHLAPVGQYKANNFGLYDMIGNVAEWTSSSWDDKTNSKVVRGGSWRDRPKRATSTWRFGYPQWRPVYNVGFRVIINEA